MTEYLGDATSHFQSVGRSWSYALARQVPFYLSESQRKEPHSGDTSCRRSLRRRSIFVERKNTKHLRALYACPITGGRGILKMGWRPFSGGKTFGVRNEYAHAVS